MRGLKSGGQAVDRGLDPAGGDGTADLPQGLPVLPQGLPVLPGGWRMLLPSCCLALTVTVIRWSSAPSCGIWPGLALAACSSCGMLSAGSAVRVRSVDGLTLIVDPEPDSI